MTLFTNDLYRNFGIGFLFGAIAVAFSNPELMRALTALVA